MYWYEEISYLITLHRPSEQEVEERKRQDHGRNDSIAEGQRQDKKVVRDALVIGEGARRPRLTFLPLSLDLELAVPMVTDQGDEARQFHTIANESSAKHINTSLIH